MYLKSLKLAGFKSFADRTRLEFRPGVTVVVGPNGSGKSNLVDALSWVLGTQSTKTLRTGKMEDVIFAGTATRPSLGKAEATLVIDNAERQIDLDLDEVSITRRLYRDGSSDYELNGVGCRLIDIQDLLSDSGVGRHQHVIIGQGEIGRVLNASPEEHRAVIEEAAGILKHRRRKERSERRLEKTDEDMLRLEDLLGEIARQMRPLRRQAKAAEKYEGLKSQVKMLRLYLGGRELTVMDRELTIATSEKSVLTEGIEVDTRRIGVLTGRIEELTKQTTILGAQVDRDTSAAAMLETTGERLRRVASVANERSKAVSGRQEAVVERRADLEEEKASILSGMETISNEISAAEAAVASAEAKFRRLEDEEAAIATQNSLSPEGALAAVRGELSALTASLARDGREIETVVHRLEVLASQSKDEKTQIEAINRDIKNRDVKLADLQEHFEEMSASREGLQKSWDEAESQLESGTIALASAEARLEAVTAALDGKFDAGAMEVAGSAEGALGSLTSQLDIPEGLEAAVTSALGGWADSVAFGGEGNLLEAVESVKGHGGGSVSMVSIGSGSKPAVEKVAVEVADQLGVDSLVSRLGPKHHRSLAMQLLGDVVLVEGWNAGWAVVSKHRSLRAVTPEGDLITAHGIRIADPDGAGSAMRESAEVELEKAVTEHARAVSRHTAARRDFDRSREAERLALENLESAESTLAGLTEAMARLDASVAGIEAEKERLTQRQQALSEAIDAGTTQSETLNARLSSLEGAEAERVRVWEDLEARRVQLASDRETARSDWQEAASAGRGVSERKRLLDDRLEKIDQELKRLEIGTTVSDDPVRLEMVSRFAKRALSILDGRLDELRERQAMGREQLGSARSDLDAVRSDHSTRTTNVSTARSRISEIDIKLTELRMRREAVVEAIRRDADSEVEDAMGAERPELPDEADLDETMESLLVQLRRLGPINPLAAAEFRQLEERHDFLASQKADVEESRSELRKVISALEIEIQLRFDQAFKEVAEAYERYFQLLFPGGRGRIRLVDADDRQSGVSIDAQPHGKKVSQMTLLSGGERSLAALAFLFAVFEARPSPFYVLDEVEAALDDANLRRFLRIVSEFRDRAQLLIVTHQQQTMEAADVLYGVTMEPGGSSKAIRKEMHVDISVDQVA